MVSIKKFSFISVILFFQIGLKAQSLSITEAVKIAQDSNRVIQSQQKAEKVVVETAKIAKRLYMPSVSLLGGYTYMSDPLAIDLGAVQTSVVEGMSYQNVNTLDAVNQQVTGAPLTDAQKQDVYNNTYKTLNEFYPEWNAEIAPQNYFTANLVVKQPLFLGGPLVNSGRIGTAEQRKVQILTEKVSNDISQKVINTYLEIILLEQLKKNRVLSLKAINKHLYNTEKLIEQGIIPAYQVYVAKAAVAKSEALNKVAVNNYHSATLSLNQLLNFPHDAEVELTTKISYIDILPPLSEIQNQAQGYSPIKRINNEELNLANYKYSSNQADFLPTVFALGELQLYQKNLPVITPPWMVGVQMKWDIFNGGRSGARLNASKVMIDQMELNNELIADEINLLTAKLYVKTQNAFEMYDAQKITVKLLTESLKAIKKEYAHGLVRSAQVVDAQAVLDDSKVAESTYLFTYYVSLAELYKLQGKLGEFLQKIENNG